MLLIEPMRVSKIIYWNNTSLYLFKKMLLCSDFKRKWLRYLVKNKREISWHAPCLHFHLDNVAEWPAKERRKAKSLGWPVTEKAKEFLIHLISPTVPLPVIQPWLLPDATADVSLIVKREKRNLVLSSQMAQAHIASYSYFLIYADASKTSQNNTGVGLFVYFVGLSQFGV